VSQTTGRKKYEQVSQSNLSLAAKCVKKNFLNTGCGDDAKCMKVGKNQNLGTCMPT